MLATLCSYENWFGPYHPQTLHLMAEVGIACWHAGEPLYARPLLERAVRDLGRHLGADHDLRLRVLATLRDLFLGESDSERAASVQKEIVECRAQRLGRDHPETLAARAQLGTLLLNGPADLESAKGAAKLKFAPIHESRH
jgi:hypothetical protein